MAVGLESHGLPAAAPYGASVTVQDHQGEGHGQQQPAQDAGYSATSAFELVSSASLPQAAVEDQGGAGSGDLLSRLTGFIKAVGNVVVQLGEYIRSAGEALNGDPLTEVPAPAPQATQAPALGSAAGAPVATGPGGQSALGAPGQPITATTLPALPPAALPDLRGGPALGTRSPAPTQRDVARLVGSGVAEALASLSLGTAGLRGGGRASQSSGFPVLNPLPPYLGDDIAPLYDFGGDFGAEPEQAVPAPVDFGGQNPGEINRSLSATARPPVQPSEMAMAAASAQAAEGADFGFVNNVIPFPGPAANNDGFQGEASGEASAQSLESESSSPRYQAIVFRPAFYGNLRC